MGQERRKNPRVQVDLQCEIFLGDRKYVAIILNISLGGCHIETSARPRLREIVILCHSVGMCAEKFPMKVAWQSYRDKTGKIGAQFYGMEEDQVRATVAKIFRSPRQILRGERLGDIPEPRTKGNSGFIPVRFN